MAVQAVVRQNSPSTLGLYLEVSRGAYSAIDMTTVVSVTATVYLPGTSGTGAAWAFTIVTAETTVDTLVLFHQFATGDTAVTGAARLVVIPSNGSPLPPAEFMFSIQGPPLR